MDLKYSYVTTETLIKSSSNGLSEKPWTVAMSLEIVTLLAGVLVAVAHHLYYHFLGGHQVGQILSQAWVINIATGMAFLTKTFLVLSASIAFVQWMFRDLRHKGLKVKDVDSMSQMLGNPCQLFLVRLWSKVPTACSLAVIVWLIPVAAVFPPGTLSISFPQSTIHTQEKPAMPDFVNGTKYAITAGSVAEREYSDASVSVYQTALASGTTGQVLRIPHSHTNMSYNVDFYGPAIQCYNASPDLNATIATYFNLSADATSVVWVSFVGGDDHGFLDASTPCQGANSSSCSRDLPLTWFNDTRNLTTLDVTSTDAARLYVWIWQYSGQGLTECKLVNASYSVNFNFTSTEQSTNVTKLEYLNNVAANSSALDCVPGDLSDCLDPKASAIDSYQAIMEAFNSLLVGVIAADEFGYSRTLTLVQMTSIAQNYSMDAPFNDHLANDLEALFQNVTLSMISSADLRMDEAEVQTVPVTITQYFATYNYRPLVLYLAYGLSILFAAFCVVIARLARQDNGASYSNKFSTYARVAVNTGLQNSISGEDSGADPCPLELTQAEVWLVDGRLSKS